MSAAIRNIDNYEATKHSFGTRYLNEGASRDLLKEWFGHTKIEMTERYTKIRVVDAFRQMLERNNVKRIKADETAK
jgi:site-specific recombinase XerD